MADTGVTEVEVVSDKLTLPEKWFLVAVTILAVILGNWKKVKK